MHFLYSGLFLIGLVLVEKSCGFCVRDEVNESKLFCRLGPVLYILIISIPVHIPWTFNTTQIILFHSLCGAQWLSW